MQCLILAEMSAGELSIDATASVVNAASGFGEVSILVPGSVDAAKQAAQISGVKTVLHVDDPMFEGLLAEDMVSLFQSLSSEFTHILAPATSSGKNIMPRLAAALDVMVLSDVIEVIDGNTFKRPIYAGNAIQTVRSADSVKVMTIRTSAYDAAEMTGAATVIGIASANATELSVHLKFLVEQSERPELSGARTIVSGGRGLGSEENFSLIGGLADKLGAAVGASRAAVDSGYASNDLQIGQTGKIVAPDLYIAVGISGAIQHLAGMKDSKVIVAINKDPDAPIFEVADYGLIGDLFEIVPELSRQI